MPAPQPTPPVPPLGPPPGPATATPDALDQLIEIGVELARLLARHAKAAVVIAEAHAACELPDPFPLPPLPNYPPDIGLTFSRIARAVRLTKALQARLARPPRNAPHSADPDTPDMARQAARDPAGRPAPLRDPDGDRVEPPDSIERLDHEIWENLEDEDSDADILARPVNEIVAVIRGDLGLCPTPAPTQQGAEVVLRPRGDPGPDQPPRHPSWFPGGADDPLELSG